MASPLLHIIQDVFPPVPVRRRAAGLRVAGLRVAGLRGIDFPFPPPYILFQRSFLSLLQTEGRRFPSS
jgi:hypothetical protein